MKAKINKNQLSPAFLASFLGHLLPCYSIKKKARQRYTDREIKSPRKKGGEAIRSNMIWIEASAIRSPIVDSSRKRSSLSYPWPTAFSGPSVCQILVFIFLGRVSNERKIVIITIIRASSDFKLLC